jgi:threonine/homoserine/homoserine lactone efflux protein
MTAAVLAFAGIAALINITPGVDTLLVLRTSATRGRPAGQAAALGILTGCVVWGLAAAIGVVALLTASHLAYDAVRIAGAAYLTWLGASTLRATFRRRGKEAPVPVPAEDITARRGRFGAFRSGVGTNLLNPKAGVFYMSLVPQFIPAGASVFGTSMLLTAVDIGELVLWFWVLSAAASALGARLRRPAVRRWLERVSGVTFLGFAANLAAERARMS